MSTDPERLGQVVRNLVSGSHAAAVVLSAYGRTADRERSFAAGFMAHQVKPLSSEAVARALLAAAA